MNRDELKAALKKHRITQKKLAGEMAVNEGTLSRQLSGETVKLDPGGPAALRRLLKLRKQRAAMTAAAGLMQVILTGAMLDEEGEI